MKAGGPIKAWDGFLETAGLGNGALSLEPYCPGCCLSSTGGLKPVVTLSFLGGVSATLRKGLLNQGRGLLGSVSSQGLHIPEHGAGS